MMLFCHVAFLLEVFQTIICFFSQLAFGHLVHFVDIHRVVPVICGHLLGNRLSIFRMIRSCRMDSIL